MTQSFFLYAPKIIFDLIFEIFYFLPWWYSRGLVNAVKAAVNSIRQKERELAVGVWIKNFHKPLLEYYTWQSRIKSVILRSGQIILRTIILSVWSVIIFFGLLIYAVAPLLVVWQIVFQLV